jgi:hypothetical protein
MNTHLYIVRHEIEGDTYISPCVGDEELKVHIEMAEHFGAHLAGVSDIEFELGRFVWECCFEGTIKGWALANID